MILYIYTDNLISLTLFTGIEGGKRLTTGSAYPKAEIIVERHRYKRIQELKKQKIKYLAED